MDSLDWLTIMAIVMAMSALSSLMAAIWICAGNDIDHDPRFGKQEKWLEAGSGRIEKGDDK